MYKYCRYVNLQMHCLICNIIRLAFQREHPKSPKTAEFARVRRNVESVLTKNSRSPPCANQNIITNRSVAPAVDINCQTPPEMKHHCF